METAPDFAFCLLTFGCKVNQYETQSIREAWLAQGGRETDNPALADVVLLNTCAVTANAVADARQASRRLARLAPRARVVIAGCASEVARGEFLALPGGALVLPQERKSDLLDVRRLFATAQDGEGADAPKASDPAEERTFPPFSIRGFRRARPVLKVQDGCSQGCAYCVVPLARGPSRSRPPADCVAEARRLLEAGYREIMLSGINLRQYRTRGRGSADFWELLRRLDGELAPEWAGEARFRISSVDPAQLDERGLDCLGEASMICPHLHLSLQSGSPFVLRAMRRAPYTPEQVLEAVAAFGRRLAARHPASGATTRFGLGADILMGFPGESETHVEETLSLVRALPLTYAHVFPFSSRPGTVAATLPDQIPAPLRQERAARVRAVVESKRRDFWKTSLAAGALRVAPDGDGSSKGVDECYVPCRFSAPLAESEESSHALILARPVDVTAAGLLVEPVSRA